MSDSQKNDPKKTSKPTGKRPLSSTLPDLDRAKTRSVRLVISLPVLTLLSVLASGILLYNYLMNLADFHELVSQARNDIERAALVILLLSIVFATFSAIFGYIIARQIVKPIHQLMETMDQIAEGDLGTTIQPIRLGEFGQLGNSFNHMVSQLNIIFEERDRQLHESFVGAHILLNRDGTVLRADQKVRRILGISPDFIIGKNLLEEGCEINVVRCNPKFQQTIEEVLSATLKGHPTSRITTLRDKDGIIIGRYLISSLRLEADGGQGAQALLEIRDVAGIAHFYEQIQRADRLAAIGTLATGIAHEVRNPLASIRGMVQLMAETHAQDDPTSKDYTDRILREVDRVEKLVRGVMDFAHTGKSPAEPTNLNELIKDSADSARMHLGEKGKHLQVECELESSMPKATIRADRMKQALLNLIINALQHCEQTGSQGPVSIRSRIDKANLQRPFEIIISNPGDPIEDVLAERLFEPFYTTKADGTGLGLPIAYQIIQSNGGVLELHSDEGLISFHIRLPVNPDLMESASEILRKAHVALDERRERAG